MSSKTRKNTVHKQKREIVYNVYKYIGEQNRGKAEGIGERERERKKPPAVRASYVCVWRTAAVVFLESSSW